MSGARLVSATLGVLALPWWPETVTRTPGRRTWAETARPGRAPLLLADEATLAEYQLSYLVRGLDLRGSVAAHVDLLERMAASEVPVSLLLGDTDRGLFHLTELSVVEVQHAASGEPSVVDVSVSLRQASEATVAVGPVPAAPTAPAVVKKTKKTLKGTKGKAGAGV